MKPKCKILQTFLSWEVVFVFCSTLLLTALYFLVVPFLEFVELKAWDLHFRQRGTVEPSGDFAFVAVDEESVNRDGRWPWPRRQMARLIEAVQDHGAKVIGLDMGFFEPDLKLRRNAVLDIRSRIEIGMPPGAGKELVRWLETIAQEEDDDLILSDTLQRLKVPLVLGHFFYFDKDQFVPEPPPTELLEKAQVPIVRTMGSPRVGRLNEAVGLEANIPVIEQSSRYMGSFNVFSDPDGTVRWMPLIFRFQDRIFPSLAMQMLAVAFPNSPLMVTLDTRGVRNIRLGSVSIPTSNKGELLLNYYGPAYTFPHFSATTLMHHESPPDCLKDRIVVIGNTTLGLYDMRPTPFSMTFPGVELHCTVMENIARQHFLQRIERNMPLVDLAAIFGLAGVFLLMQFFIRGLPLAGVVLFLFGGYILLTHWLFLQGGLWLNHVYPTMNLAVAYLGTSVHRYLREEKEKRMIRNTFSLYVHGSVVEEMLANPERLRLGGEKKELTVMFSDIRGFTTLSEQRPAEELVPQLNEYLTRMTQVVFDHHGTLDKYIGDAVMAIFGAPLPQKDHPHRACATALDMIRVLKGLQQGWKERGLPVLEIGVGINTGLMMVGNMGSERRFDYTVLGDNVNLASRLEGLTKMYGVTIVVNESTWEAAQDRFVGRVLDVVRVKGKQKPVTIHQLMDNGENAAAHREPLRLYGDGIRFYQEMRWEEALRRFLEVEKFWPGDPPSRLYQGRCRHLLERKPSEEWSFVTTLDHK